MEHIIGQRQTGSSSGAAAASMIIDATQASFVQEAIQASRSLPVLVDFWAPWCAPCKQLTPVLEKTVTAAGGRIKLVKLNIEENQGLVQQLGQIGLPLQSIPLVAAFWQGQIVDLFQGALPEGEVRRFVEKILKMAGASMPDADLLEKARAALANNDADSAIALFSQILESDPENPAAWAGLIRAFLLGKDTESAQAAAEQIPASIANHNEIVGARTALDLLLGAAQSSLDATVLQQRLEADPDNHQARFDLALALNGEGRKEEAAEALLHILRHDRSWNEEAARHQLIKFFDAWGNADPVTLKARRKFSAILFS